MKNLYLYQWQNHSTKIGNNSLTSSCSYQDRSAYKLLAHEAGVHGVWSLVIGAGNRALLYGYHRPTSHISLSLSLCISLSTNHVEKE
jgi:hypothetical protein